jgi:predicted MFS family arabinose efflux permease
MQSSVWNFGVWLAVSVSGPIAAWWGYTAFFLLAAVVAVSVAAWYVLMWNRVEELVLAREAKED